MDIKNEKWKYNRFKTCLVLCLVKKSFQMHVFTWYLWIWFFLNMVLLNMNLLSFFMFSFIDLPLCAIFLSWAQNVFSHIHGLPGDKLHIVFDNYSLYEDPTKVLSKGVDRRYERKISSLNQGLPKLGEWQDFLIKDRDKEQHCSLLAGYFVSDKIATGKTIYATKGSLRLMKTLHNGHQMVNELCSNHREADHRYTQS